MVADGLLMRTEQSVVTEAVLTTSENNHILSTKPLTVAVCLALALTMGVAMACPDPSQLPINRLTENITAITTKRKIAKNNNNKLSTTNLRPVAPGITIISTTMLSKIH